MRELHGVGRERSGALSELRSRVCRDPEGRRWWNSRRGAGSVACFFATIVVLGVGGIFTRAETLWPTGLALAAVLGLGVGSVFRLWRRSPSLARGIVVGLAIGLFNPFCACYMASWGAAIVGKMGNGPQEGGKR